MVNSKKQQTEFTEQEQKKRDKLLSKLLKTPTQPREDLKKGKRVARSKKPSAK